MSLLGCQSPQSSHAQNVSSEIPASNEIAAKAKQQSKLKINKIKAVVHCSMHNRF
jgi:hypothetical protein